MRLVIDHSVRYAFTEPQARLVQMLRMTPENTHDQTVASWDLVIDRDARTTEHRDGYGNCTTMLYCEGPLDSIEIQAHGEIVTSDCQGMVTGASDPLPPRLFLRATPATRADDAIAAFARDQTGAGDPVDRLRRLTQAITTRFTHDRGRPVDDLSAIEAFARDRATPRDMAHVLIAAARSLGLPARYVTGYYDFADDQRPTAHAWADVHVQDHGWVSLDPMLGGTLGERHVRVATALDARGAAFIAGSRVGDGEERLDVEVTVQHED